jgi:zinc and cadmium transporter
MHAYVWLAAYCLLILLFSVSGGSVPFLGRVTHGRLQMYLTLSAGVMLGAAIFHVLPDAAEASQDLPANNPLWFGWWIALAVVGLFCIERFVAPHSHEVNGGQHGHDHEHHEHAEHLPAHKGDCEHGHAIPAAKEPRAAAPAVAGWMAVFGLTIHTFINGVGLAAAVLLDLKEAAKPNAGAGQTLGLVIPGLAIFLAIVLHKPADALAISTVLSRKGVSRRTIALVQFGFALMVPAGVIAFALAAEHLKGDVQKQLMGAALAFSAGTFFFIALSDLLPEVQFHRHDRIPLFLALVISVAFMGGIALLEPHEHEEGHAQPGNEKVEPGDHPGPGGNADRDTGDGHGDHQ